MKNKFNRLGSKTNKSLANLIFNKKHLIKCFILNNNLNDLFFFYYQFKSKTQKL